MAKNDNKKYYWLKLQNDFFKRHEIKVVESMPNGKDYILFYMKLLCESTSHEGKLKFNDTIPYSPDMLSAITNTNIDIIKSAIQIFQKLEMMEVLDDGTIYMNEVSAMLGIETGGAIRKREYREGLKETLLLEEKEQLGDNSGTNGGQCPQDIRYKSIDNNKKENNKKKKDTFTKPTIEEIQAYINEKQYKNVNAEKFYYYYESKGWLVGKTPMKDWKASVVTWEHSNYNNTSNYQPKEQVVYKYTNQFQTEKKASSPKDYGLKYDIDEVKVLAQKKKDNGDSRPLDEIEESIFWGHEDGE